MSFHIKYRPQTFEAILGNRTLILALENMLKDKENCPHAFLFHGPTGTGKTTLARIVASELGCEETNVIEIDTAQFRGIDTIRDLRKNAKFAPLGGGDRVYIIDEVQKMTGDAQNAFLKILEDTPKHIYFILCTTDPQSLLPTVKNRCSQFQTSPLNDKQMTDLLMRVAKEEGESISQDIVDQITLDSQGLPRHALQILEQVLNVPEGRRLKMSQEAAIEQTESIALCRELMKGSSWDKVKTILKGLKTQDAESVRRVVLGYASSVLLNGGNSQAGLILECFEEPFYNIGFPGLVLASYRVIKG